MRAMLQLTPEDTGYGALWWQADVQQNQSAVIRSPICF
jgi:hypothetical protein